jgi:hypothetical protein
MEPIQEQALQLITQLEEEKRNMAHKQIKCVAMIQEEITTQALEALAEKALQV